MQHGDTAEMVGTLLNFSPLGAFAHASILVQLAMIVIAIAGLIAAIAAITRRMSGGPRSALVAAAGRIGLYAGIASSAYTAVGTYIAARQMHVTRFVVYEPEVIEAVYVLLLGMIVYAIARFGNAGAKRT